MLRSTPGPAEEVLGFFRWFFGVVLALGVGVVFCSLLVVSQVAFSAMFPADFAPELASSTMTMAGEVAFMSSEGCCFLAASWLGSTMLGVSASFLFSFLRPDRERIGYVSSGFQQVCENALSEVARHCLATNLLHPLQLWATLVAPIRSSRSCPHRWQHRRE